MTENLPVKTVTEIVSAVKDMPVFRKEDAKFLMEHKEHLGNVLDKTQMWRTDTQKMSIINDIKFPTTHSKFHQAILEQKVHFDQSMYLAKEYEIKKIEIDELELDIEDIEKKMKPHLCTEHQRKRFDLDLRRKKIELQFKFYELRNMQVAMKFRISEVRGWMKIQKPLLEKMRKEGMPEHEIWTKGTEDLIAMFFVSMNRLKALPQATDSGEQTNLVSLATFTYNQVQEEGLLDKCKEKATKTQLQAIKWVEDFLSKKESK